MQRSFEVAFEHAPPGVEFHTLSSEGVALFGDGLLGAFSEKSSDRTVGAYDPVAWNLWREGIFPQGLPDRAGGPRAARRCDG